MNKKSITNEVILALELSLLPEHALKMWWWPDYSGYNNLRLTQPGLKFISKAITGYTFKFTFNNSGAVIKQLAQLNTPYYVDKDSITIFSAQLATMIKMYPDFNRYLELINL